MSAIADAIRTKRDITTPLTVEDMPLQIGLIDGGGGGGAMPFLPSGAELVLTEQRVINLSRDTTFDSITPSTAAQTIKATGSNGSFVTIQNADMQQYEYMAVVTVSVKPVYDVPVATGYQTSMVHSQLFVLSRLDIDGAISRRFSSSFVASAVKYIDNSMKEQYYAGSIYSVAYPGLGTGWSVANTAVDVTDIYINTPSLTARGFVSYNSVDCMNHIDSVNTNIILHCDVYRYNKDNGIYVNLLNEL